MAWYSQRQTWQDQWVVEHIGDYRGGTFVDIGCGDWQKINNTLHFEEKGWWGVAVDSNPDFEPGWKYHRPRSTFILADATELDYSFVLQSLPYLVGYLSIDLEPPEQAFYALRAVLQAGRRFRAITFEHDEYRGTRTQRAARELLEAQGYRYVATRNRQDDLYLLTFPGEGV